MEAPDPIPAHRIEVHPLAFVKRFAQDLFKMRGSLLLMIVFWPIALITVVMAQIRRFWAVGTAYGNCAHLVSADNDEVMDLILTKSGSELSRRIRDPKDPLTSVALVKACIRQINKTNVFLNAVVASRFRAALTEARAADVAVEKGTVPTDLDQCSFWGVPLVIKECMEVHGMPYTAGIAGRLGTVGRNVATAVDRVSRSSGAIVLATTNVSEGCMWHESVNVVYGRTYNPYDFGRAAGGSSGGCGAAVGSCMTPLAITSDVGGSTRIPSVYNGVFGHKPTGGAVSNRHTIPGTGSGGVDRYCQLGPMSKHAEDLWPLLNAMMGEGEEDVGAEGGPAGASGAVSVSADTSVASLKTTSDSSGYDDADSPLPDGDTKGASLKDSITDTPAAAQASASATAVAPNAPHSRSVVLRAGDLTAPSSVDLSALKVYYSKSSLGDPLLLSALHPEVPIAIGRAVDHLKSLGSTVVPPQGSGGCRSGASTAAGAEAASHDEPSMGYAGIVQEVPEMFTLLNAFSMWSALMSREKPEPFYTTIREGLPKFTGVPAMAWEFLLCIFGLSQHHTLPALLLSLAECVVTLIPSENARNCAMALKVKAKLHGLLRGNNVLIVPSLPTPAPMHDESLLRIFDTCNTSFFNVMELPVTAVPMGLNSDGLPIGIQVVGGHGQDHLCIAVAMELQRAGLAKWEAPRPVKY